LKRKCDALKAKFRIAMVALLETKNKMGADTSEAFLLYAKAQWAAGDFKYIFLSNTKPKH